ncbi:MAG: hypothetical protein ACXWWD_06955 [Chitinophagaceae bacterium]
MPNELFFIFSADRIQELMDYAPSKIVVRSTIEEGILEGGARAGVVKVYADAMKEGSVVGSIEGCPMPPCSLE